MDNFPAKKRPHNEHPIQELLKFAAIAILIVIPIRLFIAQPFIVNGSSMVPTFADGDYLIVDEISYRFKSPERGDVIIFRFPNDPSKFFIKRIIGLPNEIVELEGRRVFITNNSSREELYEPYVVHPSENNLKIKLGDNEYFVMGDNRAQSSDSRVWGPMPKNFLVGQAFLRLLPIKEIGYLPGDIRP
jgi:signal peptidase I